MMGEEKMQIDAVQSVVVNAFTLLRNAPILFLPRFLLTAATSVLWIFLVDAVAAFPAVPSNLPLILAMFAVLIPFQVWVYNAYFILVDQQHHHAYNLVTAFRQGLRKVPHGIVGMLIPALIASILLIPAAAALVFGLLHGNILLQAAGAVLGVIVVAGVTIRFYFVPVAAVIGEDGFTANIRNGVAASRQAQSAVLLVAAFSFALLLATLFAEGALRQIGVIGFLLGRLLGAVLSVYILVLNPELYLAAADTSE